MLEHSHSRTRIHSTLYASFIIQSNLLWRMLLRISFCGKTIFRRKKIKIITMQCGENHIKFVDCFLSTFVRVYVRTRLWLYTSIVINNNWQENRTEQSSTNGTNTNEYQIETKRKREQNEEEGEGKNNNNWKNESNLWVKRVWTVGSSRIIEFDGNSLYDLSSMCVCVCVHFSVYFSQYQTKIYAI